MTTLRDDLELLTSTACAEELARLTGAATERPAAYERLTRVGRDAGIGFVRTAALLLKYETERQREHGTVEPFGATTLLCEWPVRHLFEALRACFEDESESTVNRVQLLLMEMRLLGLDQVSTESEALAFFARQHRLTSEQTAEAQPRTRRTYEVRKQAWLELNEQLGELALIREDRVLRCEALRQEFMQTFASEFLAERTQQARLEIARMALELLEKEPGLTRADLEQRLRHEVDERREKLTAYQLSAVYGLQVGATALESTSREDHASAKYLLRKLAMLTHPDRLRGLPLTDEQRRQLARLWHETNQLRAHGSGSGLLCRSNEILRRNVQLAEQILEMAGIDTLDPVSTIQGRTLEERVGWLDTACEALEQQVASMQAELYVIGRDEELNYMRALLGAPESAQEDERAAMQANAEKYRREAARLEARLTELLERAA